MSQAPTKSRKSLQGDRLFTASQWQLMWWRFTQHKLAVISMVVLIVAYLMALFCEFVAPYDSNRYEPRWVLAAPMPLHFVDNEGRFHLQPFVYGLKSKRDPDTLAMVVVPDDNPQLPGETLCPRRSLRVVGPFPI